MRALTAAMQTGVVQPVVPLVMMCRLDFDSGTVAWNTGYRDIVYGGVTYRPAGHFGSVSPVRESPGIKAATVTLTIGGIKTEVVSLLLSQPYLNRKGWVYTVNTDDQWNVDPDRVALYFKGKIDAINGVQGKTASFNIVIRSRLADWERQRTLRYTDADQQKLHPGDKGLEFVAQLSQKKIVWPRAAFLPDPRD